MANGALAATVSDLRCEFRCNPVGLDVQKPRLSWVVDSERRGERQAAWQAQVASSLKRLAQNHGDLWDGGKIVSDS